MVVLGKYKENIITTVDGEQLEAATWGIVSDKIRNKLAFLDLEEKEDYYLIRQYVLVDENVS